MDDNFFSTMENTKPYFKVALEGFAGSGKTFTAAKLAIGLHQKIGSKKPVIIFDTEKAAKFLKPLFAEAGIEVLVKESRSLADLKETMKRMREDGASDVLMIDSISHIWENFLEAYKQKQRRTFLHFQDWGILKPTWKTEFSDPFVNDPYHVIMCGRAGYEYMNEKNEETGKQEIFKSGIKMKVEGETAYEPDMLILMERFEEILDKDKSVWREATIIKDRSNLIDGQTFKNPVFENFEPAVDAMLSNPSASRDVSEEGDTKLLFKTEEDKRVFIRERDAAIENLEGLLTRIAPSSGAADKKLRLDLLDQVLGTNSWTEIKGMQPEQIKKAYKDIGDRAVSMGLAEIVEEDGKKRLVKKELGGEDTKDS